MRKVLVLIALMCRSLFGANTTITQTIVGPDGAPADGFVTLSIPAACVLGSSMVGQYRVKVPFLNGAFSTTLVPNDTCSPSTSYTAGWTMCPVQAGATVANPCPKGGTSSWTEVWRVPTTSSVLKVSDVLINTALPPPTVAINISQIPAGGLASGTYCLSVVSGAVVGLVTCATGSTEISWSTLSADQWANLTNAQWSAIAN